MANDPRAICAECGHAWTWHDRDAARKAARTDAGVDRPCYREIGAAACRCSGFRDSGEVAVAATSDLRPTGAFRNALLTLMLVALGLGLLYAYRSQAPSVQPVVYSEAVREINAGLVKKVTIVANKATLELNSNEKQQLTLPERPEMFQKLLDDYNTANPSRQITIDYQQENQGLRSSARSS